MTTLQRAQKVESKGSGPLVDVDADATTFVVDIEGQQTQVSSDHIPPAPRPDDREKEHAHPLLDGFDSSRPEPKVHDEYSIEKLTACRKRDISYDSRVRWYGHTAKDDILEPVENLPSKLDTRLLRS